MMKCTATLWTAVLFACGSGEAGLPLVATTLTGQYASAPFTPVNGFTITRDGSRVYAVGTGALTCASASADSPPDGTNAIFGTPSLDLISHSSIVQVMQNNGNYRSIGSSGGSITLTAVTEATVAGSVAFSYTDDDDGLVYAINGTFELTRCD